MLKKLINDVSKNSITHGAIPFWSWNDRLEEKELRKQIGNIHELGMKGFFMHARGGLETPYLSDEWYDAINACIDEARKLGMEAWAYDENGWPSGFGGGKLLEDPSNLAMSITCEKSEEFPKDDFYAVFVLEDNKQRRIFAPKEDTTEYYVIRKKLDVSYVDILDKSIIKKFIECTHEEYKKKIAAEDFGTTMPGFFTDEPQYYRYGTPWSNILPREFMREYGYDIEDNILKLFTECDGYKEFRYDYYKLLSKLYIDSFAKQVYEWCEENGCQLTGHTIEEVTLSGQMMCSGGVMPFYRYQHIPGIDWLSRSLWSDLMPKQLGSVCAQTGKDKAITETFACCGWDVSPSELKNIMDLQFFGGANMLCHHLYAYSIRGQRKYDYPAHFSEYLPWQKHLKDFNLYSNHLGYMLSLGSESVDTLVIHPIRDAYMYYKRGEGPLSIEHCDKAILSLSNYLSGNQIAYHYGDETLMEDMASVEGDTFKVGLCSYKNLIIPEMDTISATTAELIKKFIKNGGKVCLFGKAPTRIDARTADMSWLTPNITLEEIKEKQEISISAEGEAIGNVRATVRNTEYGRLIFVTNVSSNSYENVRIKIKNCKGLIKLDLLTLATKKLYGETCEGDFVVFSGIDSSESFVLVESNEAMPSPISEYQEKPAIFRLDGEFRLVKAHTNAMTLDTVSYSLDGGEFVDNYPIMQLRDELLRKKFCGTVRIKHTFFVDEIPNFVKVVCEPMKYKEFLVNGNEPALEISSYLDRRFRSADITPFLNVGKNEIVYSIDYFQRDEVYYVLFTPGISESLRNCLWFDTEIEPFYLFGDFRVNTDHDKFESHQNNGVSYTGKFSLSKQRDTVDITNVVKDGFPFFAGELNVKTLYDYKDGGPTELLLEGRYSVAEITVNGRYVGKLLFENHCDLSKYLKVGQNEIEIKLTNSNRNLLGPLHHKNIEPLSVGPDSFTGEKLWRDGECRFYLKDRYCFVRFGFDKK